MLADSVGEYWTRKDRKAKNSKILLGLSLASCLIMLISPIVAIVMATTLFVLHALLAMNGWK